MSKENIVFGACAKHPNFNMINCPMCEIERFQLTNELTTGIVKALEGTEPTLQDKSVMIKLSPEEIMNLIMMGAKYWKDACDNNTHLTMEQVCQFHYDMAIGILEKTDPDRFIHSS